MENMMGKLIGWIKQPKNIVFIILLTGVAIYGIMDNNLGIIIKVYITVFLFGLLIGGIFYLINNFLK